MAQVLYNCLYNNVDKSLTRGMSALRFLIVDLLGLEPRSSLSRLRGFRESRNHPDPSPL